MNSIKHKLYTSRKIFIRKKSHCTRCKKLQSLEQVSATFLSVGQKQLKRDFYEDDLSPWIFQSPLHPQLCKNIVVPPSLKNFLAIFICETGEVQIQFIKTTILNKLYF